MDSNLASLKSLTITPLEEKEKDEEFQIENSDEFDEEEDEEEEEVQLGFVEKPGNPHSLLRHLFPSKAGGIPAWLDPVNLPSEKSQTCGFCGEPLQFLLQVYASIPGKESTFHRTLVKVFRCQLPRYNPYYSDVAPRLDGTDWLLSSGAPLCCWCGTWKDEKLCGSCKKARYCSEKHQVFDKLLEIKAKR